MNIKDPIGFSNGIVMLAVGLILLYFFIDFENTNLQTFVYSELVTAAMLFLGIMLSGLGLLKMTVSYFNPPKNQPNQQLP